eukprot:UN04756
MYDLAEGYQYIPRFENIYSMSFVLNIIDLIEQQQSVQTEQQQLSLVDQVVDIQHSLSTQLPYSSNIVNIPDYLQPEDYELQSDEYEYGDDGEEDEDDDEDEEESEYDDDTDNQSASSTITNKYNKQPSFSLICNEPQVDVKEYFYYRDMILKIPYNIVKTSPQHYTSQFFRRAINNIYESTRKYGPLCFLPLVQRLYTILFESMTNVNTNNNLDGNNNNSNNMNINIDNIPANKLLNLTHWRLDMLNEIYNKYIAIEISKIFNVNIILQYLLCIDYNNDVIDTTPIDNKWSWCTDDLSIYAQLDNNLYNIFNCHHSKVVSSSSTSLSLLPL